jgi:hypothetical protein
MKNYFYILMLFISPMMIAPISGFSLSLVKDAEHFSYSNVHVAVDSLGPVFGDNQNTLCSVDNDCISAQCWSEKYVYKNELVVCENNLSVSWQVTIDANNDGTIDYEYLSNLPVGNDVTNASERLSHAIKDDNGNGIKDIYLAPTKYGDYATIYMPENGFAKGSEHKIVWKAADICGNTSEQTNLILIKDKKKPTPVCVPFVSELITDIDGNGPLLPLVEVTAIDFMNKAYDNCTADEDLFYTFDNVAPQLTDKVVFGKTVDRNVAHYFNRNGALAAYPATSFEEKEVEYRYLDGEKGIQLWDPVMKTSSFVKNCKQIVFEEDLHTNDVMVTVWDEALNWDFCWTTLKVNFGCNLDPSYATIKGNIFSLKGIPIKNATVFISAPIPESPISESTNQKGNYNFIHLYTGLQYEIYGIFESKKMQGLDYNDLSILERHISGKKLIKNPYQLIAADINGDDKIDQQDYLKLFYALKYNNEVTFARNNVVKKSNKLNATNWKYFETVFNLNLFRDTSGIDFVAIRTGDINGSHFDTGIINYDLKQTHTINSSDEVEGRSNDIEGGNQVVFSPNPFADYTTLSFFAPQADEYLLLITDLAGKVVAQLPFTASAGNNTYLINGEQIGAAGTYICTLKSTDIIVNKRLVLVR